MVPPASHQVSRAWWYSGATLRFVHFVYRAFTFCGGTFQFSSTIHASLSEWSTTPDKSGLGSSPFARRYSGNRCFFLFLRVLRCFSSPGYLLYTYFIQYRVPAHYHRWVSSFGNLRIDGCLLLPAAYRSLPRPSSAPSAKASTLCSYSLDLSDSLSALDSFFRHCYDSFLVSRFNLEIVVNYPSMLHYFSHKLSFFKRLVLVI